MSACDIVVSRIVHTRHSGPHHPASHMLKRSGLSIWIDLDRMEQAARQSLLFSVDSFNLLAFHQRDHGPNFKSKAPLVPLGHYVRQIAAEIVPDQTVGSAYLITFPRILVLALTHYRFLWPVIRLGLMFFISMKYETLLETCMHMLVRQVAKV